jgi:hypothetical protein
MGKFVPNENSFIGFTVGPVGAIGAPALPTGAESPGGALAIADHVYAITAVNESGESEASDDCTVTLATVGSATIEWEEVPGAEAYNIYGRTAGDMHLLTQVSGLSWTDSGELAPTTTAPPVVGTASDIAHPKVSDVDNCVELTRFCTSLNASSTGNNVPTPNLARLFEPSITGTSTATFTGDFYRDDTVDTAWLLLPRKKKGFMFVSRSGRKPNAVGKRTEIWPIRVSSRAMANMTSNTVETFTLTCAVPDEPNEDAVVVAG